MSCLFSGLKKGCFPAKNKIRAPKLPEEKEVEAKEKDKPGVKPTFCIYDSDDSDQETTRRQSRPPFVISEDMNIFSLADLHSTPFHPAPSSLYNTSHPAPSNLYKTSLPNSSSLYSSSLPDQLSMVHSYRRKSRNLSLPHHKSTNQIYTSSCVESPYVGTSTPSCPGTSISSSSAEQASNSPESSSESSEVDVEEGKCSQRLEENGERFLFGRKMSLEFTPVYAAEEDNKSATEKLPYVRQSHYPNLRRPSQVTSPSHAEVGRGMGAAESKTTFRQAVTQLDRNSELWEQLECESIISVQDVFSFLPSAEIRRIKEENPGNLYTLCYKLVEKLTGAVDSSCRTQSDQQTVLNSCRILTRLLPFILEDPEWRSFFWSNPDSKSPPERKDEGEIEPPLGQTMILAVSDLLFCPEFTVSTGGTKARDEVDDLENIDSCEHIWERGVGFAQAPSQVPQHHYNRCELLRLLLACFSQTMYLPPLGEAHMAGDRWVKLFTSPRNRHALPLFTSLLNTVCGYVPGGILPYNHLIWSDSKEKLVELALQVLIVTLDQDPPGHGPQDSSPSDNLFINYLSRIHRDEDFQFILQGITRLLMNPLLQTYLPNSQRKVFFHQELLILFWKMCEYNRKFLFYVLKSSDVLEILVPILHYLNDARADQSRVGLMHIGVFILLLLSGERNFGVRLNKPYSTSVPMDIPVFSGSHADLLIIVFHKIITSGHQRLQPLFDCLLTVLCNVSPYIKSMSMVAACKLIHLVEAFSTPWFLMSNPHNHTLVYFLLEMLNNLVQYQFDGNSNLVYTIIRKRAIFHSLANLPSDGGSIAKTMKKKSRKQPKRKSSQNDESMEGSNPAQPAEPGTLKASLIKFNGVESLTEPASAHPSQKQLEQLTQSVDSVQLDSVDSMMYPVQPIRDTESAQIRESPSRPIRDVLSSEEGQTSDASQNLVDVQSKVEEESSILSSDSCGKIPSPKMSRQSSTEKRQNRKLERKYSSVDDDWYPTPEWINSWKNKLPLHTVMRLLQVLVPQVEKMCMDKGLTDESEILRFLQHGTLVGLLPVPHPILIRRYQANPGTAMWFRTYMWGVIYLRNIDPAVWYDTDIKLFQVQRI